ncbi:MAG: glycerophosphodiester phosphodiesterase [Cyclobacteriaceae bacterium]|jgi:glycerophosphoryl diester phosphodiesterase|nr:glycerophosphodiester phosphodiesterase [Cyclobacteriaceae bacterium]
MRGLIYGMLVLIAIGFSCSSIDITPPLINSDENLINTTPLPGTVMKNMEGIYTLTDGGKELGTSFVCKVSKYRVSFFSEKEGIYIILKYGFNTANNSIQFSGFWRMSETADQGLINMEIPAGSGSLNLILNGATKGLTINGLYRGFGAGTKSVTLTYSRPFSVFTQNNEFIVFGHHGIQTTSNPPYAENTLKAAFHAEEYGSNGIEYDVRLTRDNVPICIHDPTINIRLTQKGPLSGDFDQYSFQFLRDFITLVDGQKIPSVEEVLRVVIDSTNLKYVWLDIKGNPGVFTHLEPVVRAAMDRATSKGRNLTIFAGLPSTDVIDQFRAQPSYASLPTLCELSVDCAIENKSKFFGPRYSEGLLLEDVDRAHAAGIKVISWTLNDKSIIHNYLRNGRFDGFITDYPAYVINDYYTNF